MTTAATRTMGRRRVESIGSISRKMLDQARAGKRTVEDSGLTERMLNEHHRRRRRADQAKALAKIDLAVRSLPPPQAMKATAAIRKREFAKREYRIAATSDASPEDILRLKHARLREEKALLVAKIRADVETEMLRHVADVTEPGYFAKIAARLKALPAGNKKSTDYAKRQLDALPSLGDVSAIHEEARRELDAHLAEATRMRSAAAARIVAIDGDVRRIRVGDQTAALPLKTTRLFTGPKGIVADLIGQVARDAAARREDEARRRREAAAEAAKRRQDRQKRHDAEMKAIMEDTIMPLMPGHFPDPHIRPPARWVAAMQAFIKHHSPIRNDRHREQTAKGLIEMAKSFGELRRKEPDHVLFRPDGVVPPEATAERDIETGERARRPQGYEGQAPSPSTAPATEAPNPPTGQNATDVGEGAPAENTDRQPNAVEPKYSEKPPEPEIPVDADVLKTDETPDQRRRREARGKRRKALFAKQSRGR